MKLSLSVDVKGVKRTFETMAESLADLREPLNAFGKYLREKSKARFAAGGPGWPALAPSSAEKVGASLFRKSGNLRLRGKLARQVAKATPEARAAILGATRSTGGGAIGAAIRAGSSGAIADAAFARLAKRLDREQKAAIDEMTPQTKRQAAKTPKAKAVKKHKLLGRLGSTLRATVERGALEVFSIVSWAGVHNDGNDKVPQRQFLTLEDGDVEVLVKLIEEHVAPK